MLKPFCKMAPQLSQYALFCNGNHWMHTKLTYQSIFGCYLPPSNRRPFHLGYIWPPKHRFVSVQTRRTHVIPPPLLLQNFDRTAEDTERFICPLSRKTLAFTTGFFRDIEQNVDQVATSQPSYELPGYFSAKSKLNSQTIQTYWVE